MRILRFEASGFRNIKKAGFSPCRRCNIFIGENGQGKTNLLEAICLFNGEKSFRRAKENDLIRFGSELAELNITFFSQGREQTAVLKYGVSEESKGKKIILLNDVKKRSSSSLHGILCMVIFSPDDLRIVKGGPEERRHLMDNAVTQLVPSYGELMNRYDRIVFQRNNLLREIGKTGRGKEMLDIWDEKLVQTGSQIIRLRKHYVERITPFAAVHYKGISDGQETLTFSYLSSGGEGDRETFLRKLKEVRERDIEQGSTGVGPHRDDLDILLDGKSARFFGSQGQQRSSVLAMKFSEAEVLEQKYGEPPVLLLDDVLSELDPGRQAYLIGKLDKYQVFLTCCEAHKSLAGRLYSVENGKIKRLSRDLKGKTKES